MSESILRDKSKEFARHVVFTCRSMREKKVEFALIDQFIRSGTSIGANIHEAQHAHGTKDFVSKLEIALKESYECRYWLDLLYDTESINKATYEVLIEECVSIQKMLSASVLTTKRNSETPSPQN